jgi:hypothetical protein
LPAAPSHGPCSMLRGVVRAVVSCLKVKLLLYPEYCILTTDETVTRETSHVSGSYYLQLSYSCTVTTAVTCQLRCRELSIESFVRLTSSDGHWRGQLRLRAAARGAPARPCACALSCPPSAHFIPHPLKPLPDRIHVPMVHECLLAAQVPAKVPVTVSVTCLLSCSRRKYVAAPAAFLSSSARPAS